MCDYGVQLQHSKSRFDKLLKFNDLHGVKDKEMFPVAKCKDLNAIIVEVPVKMRIQINFLYFLPQGK